MNLTEWNLKLFADVRSRGREGQRLYLYVDRDLLAKLSGLTTQEAVDDFCHAFQSEMGVEPFRRGAVTARNWRRQGFLSDPPIVAHLAMSVLAVTEEPVGGSHGVYASQNRLLGLPRTPTEPVGYGDNMSDLWTAWNAWLLGPGRIYGAPTADAHPHWSRQGWARSQALVRYYDRFQLDGFFEEYGPAAPFEDLMGWMRLHRPELARRFHEEPALAILRDVFQEEAERWSREGSRELTRSKSRGLLQFDLWTKSLSGAVPVGSSLIGQIVDLGDEQRLVEDSESVLTVVPRVSNAVLLLEGFEHRLSDGVVQRFGGETVYVMRDEPLIGGLMQVRTLHRATVTHVLVRQDRLPAVRETLHEAGIEASESVAAEPGWTWLKGVTLNPTQHSVLACLGLSHPASQEKRRVALQGGLRLRDHTYLVGGEPDVLFEGAPPTEVRVDGAPERLSPDASQIGLADLVLPPGRHAVESSSGNLVINSVSYVHEKAVGGGISAPLIRRHGTYVLASAIRDCKSAETMAGALLRGIAVPEPIVIRTTPRSVVLIITDEGEVSEVQPSTALWLRVLDLEPAAIDVLALIRSSTTTPVACVVVNNTRGTQAIAVPAAASRMRGRVDMLPRPDLVPFLASTIPLWSWIGPPHPRIRQIMSLAIQRRDVRRTGALPPRQGTLERRADVSDGPRADNPYDDVLMWLSEREHGRASLRDFANTWEWACLRSGHPMLAARWRRALRILEELGHIERDFAGAQIGVAPAALAALPASSGLYVLTGARPCRLLERLDDDEDRDQVVATAVSSWAVAIRTPREPDGTPAGPQAIYISWDPAYRESVREALASLGVELTGTVADALLVLQPEIQKVDLAGDLLTMSPSSEIWQRARTPTGPDWIRVAVDTAPGFYCYQLSFRKVYAWRAGANSDLMRVEYAIGEWLARTADGRLKPILADGSGRRLLAVPADAPLPRLLARALVLRCGLPPRTRWSRGGDLSYLVYENVDVGTAERVARVLAQRLKHTDITTALA